MRYQRDGFSVESAIKKNARLKPENRRPLPPWYLDEPADSPAFNFFYTSFRDLVTERRDLGPIPWSKVMAYAAHKRLDADVADALWNVIRKMDTTERNWRAENLK